MPAGPADFRDAIVLTGPTGSGKSALALELAEWFGGEIIAVDSMTLYRGMDIGTAKPSTAYRARVPHHLIDVLDPWESADVAWWLDRAAECVRDIRGRGKIPLVVGGTPFYLKAMLCGLFEGPPGDAELRRRLECEGAEILFARLQQIDPATAARLHANDIRRVVRALEVFELTKKPLSHWQTQWPTAEPVVDVLCLDVPREDLYERIDRRVHAMIEAGWLDEVRRLREQPRPMSREASLALGYAELAAVLHGKTSLDEAIALIQQKSRNFAKRQLTWFRRLPGLRFVRPDLTFAAWGLTIR